MVAPNIPSSGTYLVPGISMCSLIPNETLPYSSKLLSLTLLLTASSARLRNSPASFPRSVTTAAIGSPFLIPKSLIAFLACLVVGVLLVSWVRTFFAFSSGSPDLPVAMFNVTFSILTTLDGFVDSSFTAASDILFFSYADKGCLSAHGYHVFCWRVEGLACCLDLDYLRAGVSPRGYCRDPAEDSLVSTVDDQSQGACLKRNKSHHVLFG